MDSSFACGRRTARPCFRAAAARAVSASRSNRAATPVERATDAARRSEALPREKRLAKRREFLHVYETGRKLFSRYSVLFFADNGLPHSRIGITATKKIGKAIVRNRLKRWTREVYRHEREPLALDAKALDLVVNVKPNAADATFDDYRRDLGRALARIAEQSQG
jgi:ribonuclease P protein component